jgi:hypothetical protein
MPAKARPKDGPTVAPSAKRMSTTRFGPNRSIRPTVSLKLQRVWVAIWIEVVYALLNRAPVNVEMNARNLQYWLALATVDLIRYIARRSHGCHHLLRTCKRVWQSVVEYPKYSGPAPRHTLLEEGIARHIYCKPRWQEYICVAERKIMVEAPIANMQNFVVLQA